MKPKLAYVSLLSEGLMERASGMETCAEKATAVSQGGIAWRASL